jgi:hypothetical protein
MELDDWLKAARADAERRGLADLQPMLDTLVQATRALRLADWNEEPTGGMFSPAASGPGRRPS